LGLFGNYDINSEGLDDSAGSYTAGAMIEVALFSGFQDVSRTREARAAVEAVRAARSDLVAGIEVEARQAFYETASARERIGVAESAVGLAEENRRIVSDRYQSGLLTIVELMDAETALQEARTNRYQALYDYRASYVRLQLAAGMMAGDR
jgi:outer membrane protein TolC